MRFLMCRAAALAVLTLVPVARVGGAGDRPQVLVSFEPNAEPFSGLDAGPRDILVAHIAGLVKGLGHHYWPLLEWSADPAAPASAVAWRWRVRADQETRTVTLPNGQPTQQSLVRLHHVVQAPGPGGKSWELEQATLYDYGKKRPSTEKLMQDDMEGLIGRQFSPEFVERVGSGFLKEVQLADKIIVEAPTRVIIPLRRCDLRAGTDSQLEVKFRKNDASGAEMEGFLDLATVREVEPTSSHAGYIFGPVLILDFPPARLTDQQYWQPEFATILASIRDVRVYMLKYQLDLALGGSTSGGVILSPDPCGGAQ